MYSTEILLNTATIREVNSTEIDSNFTARETQDYAPFQRQGVYLFVEGPMSRVEGNDEVEGLLVNDDFFSEDIFLFFAGESSSVYMFLPDLI